MKALRYLLSMIVVAILSVLGVSAQTPQYGKSYKGQETQFVYTTAQMPAATMGSANSEFVHSGSTLPMAAQTGVTTTYDNHSSGPRKIGGGNSGGGDGPANPDDPWATPLGDVIWPLAMFALAFAFGKWIAKRTKPLR